MAFDAQRFSEGDALYVRQLMDEHAAVVRRACSSYARSPDHAEDLWQETWVRVLLSGHTFRGEGSFRGWLSRVARNACSSDQRSFRMQAITLDWLEDGIPASAPSPLQLLVRQETREHVRRAVSALTPREREAVELRVLEGRPTGEVAEMLGVSKATVRSHLRHAMAHLRALLSDEHPGRPSGLPHAPRGEAHLATPAAVARPDRTRQDAAHALG